MIKRFLEHYLRRDAGYYPVLTLTGPRQSGKTVLARAAFPEHDYVNLEETEPRLLAKEDPRGFLNRFRHPVILDEVQRAPDIFSYIQTAVDRDATPGRFVLTGSHNFLLMKELSQTLAGRCGVLHLLPFSRAELEGNSPKEPSAFRELFSNQRTNLELWPCIWTGFYPRIHDRGIPPEVWLSDYLQTYIERDVRSLVNVGDLETFERFLMITAGRVGQLLNFSSLAGDCGISVDTARRWISVLKTSFIIMLLTPHHRNFNKRLIKSPKLYFYDTGLACHLLRIREVTQLEAHPLRGALFENYVVAEVAKAYLHSRRTPPIYFWRDQGGHEVDLLVEEGTELRPVELKSGQTFSPSMLDTLGWWCRLSGESPDRATLVYGGNDSWELQGIKVRPWFAV
jgi:predicted AAA+ superfamily ATPase